MWSICDGTFQKTSVIIFAIALYWCFIGSEIPLVFHRLWNLYSKPWIYERQCNTMEIRKKKKQFTQENTHTCPYWYVNKYIAARNCLHSSKQSNSKSFTPEFNVLFTAIKTLHQFGILLAFSTTMLVTTKKVINYKWVFLQRQNVLCQYFFIYRGQNLQGAN